VLGRCTLSKQCRFFKLLLFAMTTPAWYYAVSVAGGLWHG
jgi:hypothetical protein